MRNQLPKPIRIFGYHKHHVFGGSRRKWSEKYGCFLYLSPEEHLGAAGAHFNKEFAQNLHEEYQELLESHGWTREEFRETFGKSYL